LAATIPSRPLPATAVDMVLKLPSLGGCAFDALLVFKRALNRARQKVRYCSL
jgi:hypothetical protein